MQVRYTPAAGFVGVDTFVYEVRNPDGGPPAFAEITVEVIDDEFMVFDGAFELRVGQSIDLFVFDNNVTGGFKATYSVLGVLPAGLSLTPSGIVTGTALVESQDSVEVLITLSDGRSAVSRLSWSILGTNVATPWLSPVSESVDDSDAERVNRTIPALSEFSAVFPVTSDVLEGLADDLQ